MDKKMILRILKEEKSTLQEKYFIEQVGLFGSYATNKNTIKSDIDIVYEMQRGHYLEFDEKSSLEKYLKSRLKKKIDLVSLKYMNPTIRVKAEPDILYV
jgi:uncharacterized protein